MAVEQTKDEFSLFEEELKEKPSATPAKPPAVPKVTAPTVTAPKVDTPATPSAPTAPSVPVAAPIPAPATETAEQKIERLKTEIRKSPKNSGLIVDLAEELYNKEEYEKVTLLLWKHVDKIDRRGLLLLARSHEKRKEPTEMIRALNVAIGKDQKDYEAYSLMGNAYLLQKKNHDAMESYKRATELNPKYEPAYDGLVNLYENRDVPNLYELRILFQDMVQSIGPRPQYLRKLCEINTRDGTYEPAVQSCKEAIQKDPKTADAYVYLGIAYKELGQDATALKTLKKAAADFPTSELAQFNYGRLLEDQKSYIEAMKVYKAGTEANAKAARSWLGLATTSFELRKYDISLLAYKNACKFDKKNAVAFRRATTVLRNAKNSKWTDQFEVASDNCTF
ncbi:tetratricopeptide repeat protein [Bdellovibrio bacteriovorus]|uniref:tetratricopeptide repeat protein n=1 Tax=Bdellovibrio bacteriovorus TaxID=959 RepID=UPI0021CF62B2|nr:tetratricopeptide repeat protein [Bdellovibrio bacteriovorus]UXR65807.1 tetratricopeptide repeat protein [Bdellovibrio bacteriovorus]